jgi:hypothetical protein
VSALLPGSNFTGVQTGGTFQIDPNAIAAPIGQAYNAQPAGMPGVDQAFAQAQALLAGMGVPNA